MALLLRFIMLWTLSRRSIRGQAALETGLAQGLNNVPEGFQNCHGFAKKRTDKWRD
jgi:hypothetical protein